jgi:hypothetical protein
MDIITSLIAVFGASIIELWLGVPLGFFLNLNPVLIAIISAAGSILSAYLVIILGEGIRKRFIKWRYGKQLIKKGRIYDIWNKYGIIGLGLYHHYFLEHPSGLH